MLKEFVKNEEEAKIALLGTILADGSIQKERYTPSNNIRYKYKTYVEITHTSKNLDYLREVGELFKMIEGVTYKIVAHNKVTKDKVHSLYRLYTNSTPYFSELRDILYNKNRVKLFPKEVINNMTDLSLLLLYLDDGSLKVRYYKNSLRVREIRVTFCLDSFTIEELEYFRSFLKEKYSIDSHIYKHSKNTELNRGFRIWLNTQNTKKFMNVINKFYNQVPSMNYKFTKYYSL